MPHEDNSDVIWFHDIKSHISRIRTKANTVFLIRSGSYSLVELITLEKDLWDIAEVMDKDVASLFIEIKRLKQKCGEM
jgi:hypothetical protein